jgi:hypothetical protein
MTIVEKLTNMLEKCNKLKTVYDENDETSDDCLHYKINSIKQIKKILKNCKKNEFICKWTNYHFPKSFLLVIHIADNVLRITLDNYFKTIYGIDSDNLQIQDDDYLSKDYGYFIENKDVLKKVLLADPTFYNMYMEYTTYMSNLNDIMVDNLKLTNMNLNDLEIIVDKYVANAKKICAHLISLPHFKCENCICNIKNIKNI